MTETTLRRGIETTDVVRVRLVEVRCVGTNIKEDQRCNRLLGWLDGTARLRCPRCRTTMVYNVAHGSVRAATDQHALTMH
jgi:hypothetical protein